MVSFTAHRSAPELVSPARPTPKETKALSDIDDFSEFWYYAVSTGFFCRELNTAAEVVNPAWAIKVALAEALVYYYPIAGRLREVPGGKLVVDCTGEGVVFVEADADVRLEEFGRPPYPCADEFLCDVDERAGGGVVGKPLFYMQVTRLKHGAFVIGCHVCHNIADGVGVNQFIQAIAELARGEAHPAVWPIWEREHIFMARTPPYIRRDIYPGLEPFLVGDSPGTTTPQDVEEMVGRWFHFSPKDIAVLRRHVAGPMQQHCTTFELLTAFLWRCRTEALGHGVGQRVRLVFALNARGDRCMLDQPIPMGYYGNATLRPMVEAGADDLCRGPLGHAVELVREAKLGATTEEHLRSMVDMMASLRTNPRVAAARASLAYFYVSDITRLAGRSVIDFGWAKRIGGWVLKITRVSYYMACKDKDGEKATVVSMLLPRPAMDRLAKEISMWVNGHKFIVPTSSM